MRLSLDHPGHLRVATLDIETTHYHADQGEIVAIGVGVHQLGTPPDAAEYEIFRRDDGDEVSLIRDAMISLASFNADQLVTFNGTGFDLPFIANRLRLQNAAEEMVAPDVVNNHVDLFAPRKEKAGKYPSLKECLETYNVEPPKTYWRGQELDNTRFGEEFAPEFLDATFDSPQYWNLARVLDHYLQTDLEANLSLYHHDIGDSWTPQYDPVVRFDNA